MRGSNVINRSIPALFFLVFLVLFLCNALLDPVQASESGQKGHFLWSMQGGRAKIFLLGSLHIMKPGSYPLEEAIEQAYDQCSRVFFETDIAGMQSPEMQRRLLQTGMYPEGETLEDHLSNEAFQMFTEKMAAAGLPPASLLRFRPWLTALTITVMEFQRLGFDPSLGIDAHFFKRAKRDGKAIDFLEPVESQINLFARMDESQQETFLIKTLEEIGVIKAMAGEMIHAWETGDTERLGALMNTGFEGNPELYELMMSDRNRQWVDIIEKIANDDTDTLVIVGAGHLTGPANLIELLSERGYILEQE